MARQNSLETGNNVYLHICIRFCTLYKMGRKKWYGRTTKKKNNKKIACGTNSVLKTFHSVTLILVFYASLHESFNCKKCHAPWSTKKSIFRIKVIGI